MLEHCGQHPVLAARAIHTPEELAVLLQELTMAVASGHLEQLRPDSSQVATQTAVADIPADGPWDDYIELRFRTPEGQPYSLAVDTFHGAGGSWGPA